MPRGRFGGVGKAGRFGGFSNSSIIEMMAQLDADKEYNRLNRESELRIAELSVDPNEEAQRLTSGLRDEAPESGRGALAWLFASLEKPMDTLRGVGEAVGYTAAGNFAEAGRAVGRAVGSAIPFSETFLDLAGLDDEAADLLQDKLSFSTGTPANRVFGSQVSGADAGTEIGRLFGNTEFINKDPNWNIFDFQSWGDNPLQASAATLFGVTQIAADPLNFAFTPGAVLKAGFRVAAEIPEVAKLAGIARLSEQVAAGQIRGIRSIELTKDGVIDFARMSGKADGAILSNQLSRNVNEITRQIYSNTPEGLSILQRYGSREAVAAAELSMKRSGSMLPGISMAEQYALKQRRLFDGEGFAGAYGHIYRAVTPKPLREAFEKNLFGFMTGVNQSVGAGSVIFREAERSMTQLRTAVRAGTVRAPILTAKNLHDMTEGAAALANVADVESVGRVLGGKLVGPVARRLRKYIISDADTPEVLDLLEGLPSMRYSMGFGGRHQREIEMRTAEAFEKAAKVSHGVLTPQELNEAVISVIETTDGGAWGKTIGTLKANYAASKGLPTEGKATIDLYIAEAAKDQAELNDLLIGMQNVNKTYLNTLVGDYSWYGRILKPEYAHLAIDPRWKVAVGELRTEGYKSVKTGAAKARHHRDMSFGEVNEAFKEKLGLDIEDNIFMDDVQTASAMSFARGEERALGSRLLNELFNVGSTDTKFAIDNLHLVTNEARGGVVDAVRIKIGTPAAGVTKKGEIAGGVRDLRVARSRAEGAVKKASGEARKTSPKNIEAMLDKAAELEKNGDAEEAWKIFDEAERLSDPARRTAALAAKMDALIRRGALREGTAIGRYTKKLAAKESHSPIEIQILENKLSRIEKSRLVKSASEKLFEGEHRFSKDAGKINALDFFMDRADKSITLPRDFETLAELSLKSQKSDVIADFNRVFAISPKTTSEALKAIDGITGAFRKALLAVPTSLANDHMGNLSTHFILGGGSLGTSKKAMQAYYYVRSQAKNLSKRARSFYKTAAIGFDPKTTVKTASGQRLLIDEIGEYMSSGVFSKRSLVTAETRPGQVSALATIDEASRQQLAANAAEPGLMSRAASALPKVASAVPRAIASPIKKTTSGMMALREELENGVRAAQMLTERLKGHTVGDSVSRTQRLFFDFSDVTRFEKDVLRRLTLFYTWAKKTMPLVARTTIEDPIRHKMLKLAVGVSMRDDKDLEDWANRLPGHMAGLDEFGNPTLVSLNGSVIGPSLDLLQGDIVTSAIRMAAPVLRIPAEYAMDTDMYTGRPLGFDPHDRETGEALDRAPSWLAYLPKGIRDHMGFTPLVDKRGNVTKYSMDPRWRWLIANVLPSGGLMRSADALSFADPNKTPEVNMASFMGVKMRGVPQMRAEERDLTLMRKAKAVISDEVYKLPGRPLVVVGNEIRPNTKSELGAELQKMLDSAADAAEAYAKMHKVKGSDRARAMRDAKADIMSKFYPTYSAVIGLFERIDEAERLYRNPEEVNELRTERLSREILTLAKRRSAHTTRQIKAAFGD